MPTPQLIRLASTSATRRGILAAAGLAFDCAKPTVDEAELKAAMPGATVSDIALSLARAKALSLSTADNNEIVIGADQTLELKGRLFDKPASLSAAQTQLQALRGKTHHLHSGIACAKNGRIIWEHLATANLTMRQFTDDELNRYLAAIGDRALTSVGAYQIEGLGITLFEKIEGDYFTILGLPLLPLLAFLRQQGCRLP